MKVIRTDVTVVGAGVTGIMLTRKLAALGLNVTLLECEQRLAGGTSTRNEGWLHRGTYHATSIKDRAASVQVARRCIYGHEQIRNYAPEAIEEPDLESIAVTYDMSRLDEIISRWDEAGVTARLMSHAELVRAAPEVRAHEVAAAFWVSDVGVDTRLLYRRNVVDAERAGARILCGATPRFVDRRTAILQLDGERVELQTKITVCTSGYGVKTYFKNNFGIDVPLRFWKSHLLVVPRLTRHGTFCLDAGAAAMMNHGAHSIVGLNEDALHCDSADFDVIAHRAQSLKDAIDRLFSSRVDGVSMAVACTKVDMADLGAMARSLSISVSEPVEDQLCVLPGKMTEAPFVTDAMTKVVMTRIGCERIELRPCDTIGARLERTTQV